ncbi:MAG: hypothetical protein ACRDZR_14920 [Acidimicrobiales bacterium]
MRRKTLDLLLTAIGAGMTLVLVVAGVLLMWGASFANDSVHNQLAQQEIVFPTQQAFAHAKAGTEITPSMIPSVSQYAGQQLLTGQQAKVYADTFIAVHLSEMPYHGVYAKVSAASRANPTTAKLSGLVQTTFQGTTLRGLLLEAYAFSVFGEIAFVASIASFVLAGLMLLLTVLGLLHLRRVGEDAQFPRIRREEPVAQAA